MRTIVIMIVVLIGLAGCGKASEVPHKPETTQPGTGTQVAHPALWLVQDEDTKIYLFGTVHILKPGLDWQNPKIINAVKAADAIYLETDIEKVQDGSLMGEMVRLAANRTDCDLRCLLPDDKEEAVYAFGDDLGMPPAMLDKLQPWMVGMTFQALYMTQHGYLADQGVEKTILKIAHEQNISLRYFETPLQQIHFFADLPPKDQTAFLIGTVESFNEDPKALDELIADWASGNVKGIAARLSKTEDFGNAHVYEVLLAGRNKRWYRVLENLLAEEQGTYFVAVGAAHLAGPDSVIAQMRAHGLDVVRE